MECCYSKQLCDDIILFYICTNYASCIHIVGLFQSLPLNDGDLSRRTVLVSFLHSATAQAVTFPLLRRVLGTLNAQPGLFVGGCGIMKNINNVFSGAFPMSATPLISGLLPDCMTLSCWLFLRSKWSSQWRVLSRRMRSRVQGAQEKNSPCYSLFLLHRGLNFLIVSQLRF